MRKRIRKILGAYNVPRLLAFAAGISVVLTVPASVAAVTGDPRIRAALVFATCVGVIFCIIAGIGMLHLGLQEHDRQIRALINVRPLYGLRPLRIGDGWAADPHLLETLALILQSRRPSLIVELGSGATTVVIAEHLRDQGNGRLISIDHDETFAGATQAQLVARGLDAFVDVVVAPLSRQEVNGRGYMWYTADWAKRISGQVDLLIVDGPPANLQAEARFPAGPLLGSFLSPNATIILDDGNRADERVVALKWADSLGFRPVHTPFGKGVWILERVNTPVVAQSAGAKHHPTSPEARSA